MTGSPFPTPPEKAPKLRTILMGSPSWQRIDAPGTDYRYQMFNAPVFEDGKQAFHPDGRPKLRVVFQPEEIPRIALYD